MRLIIDLLFVVAWTTLIWYSQKETMGDLMISGGVLTVLRILEMKATLWLHERDKANS